MSAMLIKAGALAIAIFAIVSFRGSLVFLDSQAARPQSSSPPKPQRAPKQPDKTQNPLASCGCGEPIPGRIALYGTHPTISHSSAIGKAGSTGEATAYCYASAVLNNTGATLYDVDWPTQSVYYPRVESKVPLCQTVIITGESNESPGMLMWAPGQNKLPTDGYLPKAGWARSKMASIEPDPAPMLSASITIPRSAGATPPNARVYFRSTVVERTAGSVEYAYELSTDSRERLHVFWNIPQTPELKKQFRDPERSFDIDTGNYVKGLVVTKDRPGWALVPVVIRDAANALVAYTMIETYGARAATLSNNTVFDRPSPERGRGLQ